MYLFLTKVFRRPVNQALSVPILLPLESVSEHPSTSRDYTVEAAFTLTNSKDEVISASGAHTDLSLLAMPSCNEAVIPVFYITQPYIICDHIM